MTTLSKSSEQVEEQREEFEAWARPLFPGHPFLRERDGKYYSEIKQQLFEAWQAAWSAQSSRIATLEAEIEQARKLMARAASSVESYNMRADDGEQFLRCNICGTPDHDEMGPQHTEECFITRLRTASTPPTTKGREGENDG